MKTTIDAAGRVVIPKALRDRAGLKAGAELECRYSDGVIEIVPPAPKGRVVREGSFLVWEPEEGSGTVTSEQILELIEEDRNRRLDEIADRSGL
jgi:AbrB family looped-hinge helix DNA binding protein